MPSSIKLLMDALARMEQLKHLNSRFGPVVDLQSLITMNASVATYRVMRHAWRELGVQS